MGNIFVQIIERLAQLGVFSAISPGISVLFSGISYLLPSQNDFQEHHEVLAKIVLKKRADALIKFVASLEFLPESIMEVKDVRGEELINGLDKYGIYKDELVVLSRSFYRNESCLRTSFFLALAFLIIGLIDPYVGAVTFLLGGLLIIFIFYVTRKLSNIKKRLHELKLNPDLI